MQANMWQSWQPYVSAWTLCGLVMPNSIGNLGQHWFRQWLAAYSNTRLHLSQSLFILNRALMNELQGYFNEKQKLFLQEHRSENVICSMSAMFFFRPQHIKHGKGGSGYSQNLPAYININDPWVWYIGPFFQVPQNVSWYSMDRPHCLYM